MRRALLLAALSALLVVGVAAAAGTFSYDPPPETFSYDPPPEQVTVHGCIDPAPYTTAAGDTIDVGQRCRDFTTTYDPAPRDVTYDPAPRDVTCPDDVCPPPTSPPPPPPPAPACSDGADNDGDGKVDYPADPGCTDAQDTDETDPAPPPSGAQANIWVDTNGGSCERSATPAAYADASACGSLDEANDICEGGDTVFVHGGTYPQSDVDGNGVNRSASARCTFDVPDGQTATIGCKDTSNGDGVTVGGASCIDVYGSYLVFRRLESQHYVYSGHTYYGRVDTERGASYITFERMHVGAVANGAAHVDVLHNEIGPGMDPFNSLQVDGGNATWDSNYFHDLERLSAGHIECLVWEDTNAGNRLTNNLFKNCAVYDVGIMPDSNMGANVIEHNAFWEPFYAPDGNNANVWMNSHGGACNSTVSDNWFGDGTTGSAGWYVNCPGVVDGGGNTFHAPDVEPPDPRLP